MSRRDQNCNNTCLIQRFIIFHLGLLPGNILEGFDEAASIAEICEHVLYYKEHGRDPPADHGCRYMSEEAIKFGGLCRAFYSIQSTIDHQMDLDISNDEYGLAKTKEIYLSTCTLVFIPLEIAEIDGLVAVAQLPRKNRQLSTPKEKKTESVTDHFNPMQLRNKVQKAHDLFKLMNGGGIHRRLCVADGIQCTVDDNTITSSKDMKKFVYPGMTQLYERLKQKRKMESLSHAYSFTQDEATNLENEIGVVHSQISELIISLPISALRLDLKQFYDSFLRNIGVSEC